MNVWRFTTLALLLAGCSSQPGAPTRKQPAQPSQAAIEPVARATATFSWKPTHGIVTHLQFAPDDNRLVVALAPKDETLKRRIVVLNVANAKVEYGFESLFPTSICFSPDGSRLAVLAADELTIHDIDIHEISVRIDRKHPSEIQSLGFTADGAILVGAAVYLDLEKQQVAWNTKTGETVPKPDGPITWHGRGLSRDGSMFFSGGWPGPTPRIYKTDRTDRITFCYRDEYPIAASFTPDSKNLVTIHEDGLLVVWEIKPTDQDNAKQLVTQANFDDCRTFAVSNDRKWIATAEKDSSIRIRDFPTDG